MSYVPTAFHSKYVHTISSTEVRSRCPSQLQQTFLCDDTEYLKIYKKNTIVMILRVSFLRHRPQRSFSDTTINFRRNFNKCTQFVGNIRVFSPLPFVVPPFSSCCELAAVASWVERRVIGVQFESKADAVISTVYANPAEAFFKEKRTVLSLRARAIHWKSEVCNIVLEINFSPCSCFQGVKNCRLFVNQIYIVFFVAKPISIPWLSMSIGASSPTKSEGFCDKISRTLRRIALTVGRSPRSLVRIHSKSSFSSAEYHLPEGISLDGHGGICPSILLWLGSTINSCPVERENSDSPGDAPKSIANNVHPSIQASTLR
mmetsp:Transcript_10428/g.26269  ORF Transcript_10428/g.26269 Transcript_10428/m.26269 type:complete len:317 (-) Transcript_10428:1118-2068(-)